MLNIAKIMTIISILIGLVVGLSATVIPLALLGMMIGGFTWMQCHMTISDKAMYEMFRELN